MNSGAMVLYRFLFAALGLLPFLLTHRPGLNRREWLTLLFASVLGVPLQFLFQFHGLALTTVSHAALMVGTMPVILAVGATLFAHERLHTLGWVALAVSTTGAALIALGGTHHADPPTAPRSAATSTSSSPSASPSSGCCSTSALSCATAPSSSPPTASAPAQ